MSEYLNKKEKMLQHLGGSCVKCGTNKNIEIDHINHLDKKFTLTKNWGLSWKKLLPELNKCQLLCKECHDIKTKNEGSKSKGWTNQPRQTHGTVWSYNKYKCRCIDCKQAKSVSMKKKIGV